MSFLPIFRILENRPDIKAMLGENLRVYEDIAPVGIVPPYAVFQVVGASSINHLDESANFHHVMYQFIVYGIYPRETNDIKDAVLQVLEQYSFILNPLLNSYETETKLFGRGFDANWHLPR
ncbi:DUF3168 domain-containing protein [Acinetobacter pittii]|uniref:tail completion protein gp17 n=1 Tax=Acinetobacter pittii TaxID=48296 RepID=UPI003AF7BD1D